MNRTLTRPLAATAVALLGLVGSAAQAQVPIEDWQHVATACTPASLNALRYGQFNLSTGYIRAVNTDVGTLEYTCNVLDSFASYLPAWNHLVLQYRDTAGGRVRATLYQKNKVSGAAAPVATVLSTPAAGMNNVDVPIPQLNFSLYGYYVVLSLTPGAVSAPQVHMVQLKQ